MAAALAIKRISLPSERLDPFDVIDEPCLLAHLDDSDLVKLDTRSASAYGVSRFRPV